MKGETISISHGGVIAFEEERPVPVEEFDFDSVDKRIEEWTPEQQRMLSLENFDAERRAARDSEPA